MLLAYLIQGYVWLSVGVARVDNPGDWWAFKCNQWTGLSWGYRLMGWFQYNLIFTTINLMKRLVYFHWLYDERNGSIWFLLHPVPMLLLSQEYEQSIAVVRNWPVSFDDDSLTGRRRAVDIIIFFHLLCCIECFLFQRKTSTLFLFNFF